MENIIDEQIIHAEINCSFSMQQAEEIIQLAQKNSIRGFVTNVNHGAMFEAIGNSKSVLIFQESISKFIAELGGKIDISQGPIFINYTKFEG